MRLMLAQPERMQDFHTRLKERLPALAGRLEELERDSGHVAFDPDELRGRVLGTRSGGQDFVRDHPEVSDTPQPIEIDCKWVEVVAPTYVQEILKAWPHVVFINANEDVQETINLVRRRLQK